MNEVFSNAQQADQRTMRFCEQKTKWARCSNTNVQGKKYGWLVWTLSNEAPGLFLGKNHSYSKKNHSGCARRNGLWQEQVFRFKCGPSTVHSFFFNIYPFKFLVNLLKFIEKSKNIKINFYGILVSRCWY
jgi:hypothetical protein